MLSLHNEKGLTQKLRAIMCGGGVQGFVRQADGCRANDAARIENDTALLNARLSAIFGSSVLRVLACGVIELSKEERTHEL